MTPYEIDLLLHYHTSCDDHPDVARNPPIWRPTMDSFITQGLLRVAVDGERRYGASWVMTERGNAYCRALQEVPLPEPTWFIRWPVQNVLQKLET